MPFALSKSVNTATVCLTERWLAFVTMPASDRVSASATYAPAVKPSRDSLAHDPKGTTPQLRDGCSAVVGQVEVFEADPSWRLMPVGHGERVREVGGRAVDDGEVPRLRRWRH